MNFLPPDKHIIASKYLPAYKQSPHGICYLVALFSSISNLLARQKDCKVQISLWQFIDCFEKYIANLVKADSDNAITGENFMMGKICDLIIEEYHDTDQSPRIFELKDYIIYPKNIDVSIIKDVDKLISPAIFNTVENFTIDEIYINKSSTLENVLNNILTSEEFLGKPVKTYSFWGGGDIINLEGGVDPDKRSLFIKCKLTVSNIRNVSLSFKDVVDSLYNKGTHYDLRSIKTWYASDTSNKFNMKTSEYLQKLLCLIGLPLNIICSNFSENSESRSTTNLETINNDCFNSNECTARVYLTQNKDNYEALEKVIDLNNLKALISSDKIVFWRTSRFMTTMLTSIDICNFKIDNNFRPNNTIDDITSKYTLDTFLNDWKAQYQSVIDEEDDDGKLDYEFFNLMKDFLYLVFVNKVQNENPSTNPPFTSFDLTQFSDLYAKQETLKYDNNNTLLNLFVLSGTHIVMIYGYEELDNNRTKLYIKNNWDGDNGTSDTFTIIVKNNLVLKDEKQNYGGFGELVYLKDSDIKIMLSNDNICNCCSLTPTPTITPTSTLTPTPTPTQTPTITTSSESTSSSSSSFFRLFDSR